MRSVNPPFGFFLTPRLITPWQCSTTVTCASHCLAVTWNGKRFAFSVDSLSKPGNVPLCLTRFVESSAIPLVAVDTNVCPTWIRQRGRCFGWSCSTVRWSKVSSFCALFFLFLSFCRFSLFRATAVISDYPHIVFFRYASIRSSIWATFRHLVQSLVLARPELQKKKIWFSCNSAWVYTVASTNYWYSWNSGDNAEQGGIKQELQEIKCVVFILHWKIDHANQIQAFKQVEARIKPWFRRKSTCFHRNFVIPMISSSLICGHLIWIYARIMIPLWFTWIVNSAVNNRKEVWNHGGSNRELERIQWF